MGVGQLVDLSTFTKKDAAAQVNGRGSPMAQGVSTGSIDLTIGAAIRSGQRCPFIV